MTELSGVEGGRCFGAAECNSAIGYSSGESSSTASSTTGGLWFGAWMMVCTIVVKEIQRTSNTYSSSLEKHRAIGRVVKELLFSAPKICWIKDTLFETIDAALTSQRNYPRALYIVTKICRSIWKDRNQWEYNHCIGVVPGWICLQNAEKALQAWTYTCRSEKKCRKIKRAVESMQRILLPWTSCMSSQRILTSTLNDEDSTI